MNARIALEVKYTLHSSFTSSAQIDFSRRRTRGYTPRRPMTPHTMVSSMRVERARNAGQCSKLRLVASRPRMIGNIQLDEAILSYTRSTLTSFWGLVWVVVCANRGPSSAIACSSVRTCSKKRSSSQASVRNVRPWRPERQLSCTHDSNVPSTEP
jgi:hypothetical protein